MIEGKWLSPEDDLNTVLNIRNQVFCQEMGIPAELENDGLDERCMHNFVYAEGIPAACGRIMYDGWQFKISRVAVLPEFRRKKYGDFLVRILIDRALQAGAAEVKAEATEDSIAFFESIGFMVDGDSYQLGEVKVISMKLLTAALHSCSGCH